MGLMTLGEFRNELHAVFADRKAGNERVDRWINQAYFEICGMADFEDLKCRQEFTTIEGVSAYEMPDGFIKFISVFDTTNKRRMLRLDQEQIALQDVSEEGWTKPERWAIHGNTLYMFPPADDAYEVTAIFLKEPDPLVDADDTTVIPPTWDLTILFHAQKIGWFSYGEIDKGNALMRVSERNFTSRLKDNERLNKTPQAGLQVAHDWIDLEDQL